MLVTVIVFPIGIDVDGIVEEGMIVGLSASESVGTSEGDMMTVVVIGMGVQAARNKMPVMTNVNAEQRSIDNLDNRFLLHND